MLSFSFPFPLLLYLLGALFTKIGKYRLFCSLFGLHVTFGSVHMQILNMALNRLTEKPHLYCHNTLDSVKRANALTHTHRSIVSATCIYLSHWATIVHCIYQRNKRSVALEKIIASVTEDRLCMQWQTCTFFHPHCCERSNKNRFTRALAIKRKRSLDTFHQDMCLHISICLAPETTFQSIEKHI